MRQRKQNGRQPRFVPHALAQAAQRKHKIRLALQSPIVDRDNYKLTREATLYRVKTSNCTSRDHRDKIKVPDPVVKDLISSKL